MRARNFSRSARTIPCSATPRQTIPLYPRARAISTAVVSPESVDTWTKRVRLRAPEGLDGLKALVQELGAAGTPPSIATYHAIAPFIADEALAAGSTSDPHACSNRVYALLEEWNDLLAVRADDSVGRIIMERIIGATGVPTTTIAQVLSVIYHDISLHTPFAADEVLSDTTALIYIRWLCDVRGGNDVRAAREAFTYFLGIYDANPAVLTPRDGEPTPVQEMSAVLLTAIAKRGVEAAQGATSLIDDLRERGFTLPERDKMRVIKRLMEATVDHRDAFRMYSWVRGLSPRKFTYDQYGEMITFFADLSLPKSPRAPPELLAEFITDIKRAGQRMDAKMYTTIVSRFTRFLRNRRRQLTESDLVEMFPSAEDTSVSQTLHLVRKLHGTIRLDSFLDVDIPLLNALMDAYNQLGAWPECFTVWQELVDQHAWTDDKAAYQPSLSIILDACGYSGQLERGRRIWRWAMSGGVPVNRNNVAAWVECLCRSGRVEEAAELVSGDLVRDVEVDRRMLELPLKFAWRCDEDVRQRVRERIKQAYPDEWETLKSVAPKSASVV